MVNSFILIIQISYKQMHFEVRMLFQKNFEFNCAQEKSSFSRAMEEGKLKLVS